MLPVFDVHEVHTESIQIESNFERARFKEDICYSISEVSSKSTSFIIYLKYNILFFPKRSAISEINNNTDVLYKVQSFNNSYNNNDA